MRQVVKIIRKADLNKQYKEMLLKDLDYELSSLFLAMKKDDKAEIEKSKKRLKEIHEELEVVGGIH